MDIRKSDVVALKIAYTLIHDYQYRIVVVKNDGKNIWLANDKQKKFQLVKISSFAAGESFFSRNYIDQVKYQVDSNLHSNVDLLEIYTGERESELEFEDNVVVWSTHEEAELPQEIAAMFPLLISAFNKIDDPETDFTNLKISLQKTATIGGGKSAKIRRKTPLITWLVIILCVVVYGLSVGINSISSNEVAVAIVLGAYYKAFILGMGEYWRLLTCGFVHIELGHLVFNLLAFYSIGMFLEPIIRRKRFVAVLLCAIVMGGVFEFIGSDNSVALGLSGGVYGLMAVLIMLFIKTGMIKNAPLRNRVILTGVICLFDNFQAGISWLGHIGGLVAGIMLGLLFLFGENKTFRRNTVIACTALVGVLLFLMVQNADIKTAYLATDNSVISVCEEIGFSGYGAKIEQVMYEYYKGR